MNWKREITAKQSIKNKKNVDDWKFSVHFISCSSVSKRQVTVYSTSKSIFSIESVSKLLEIRLKLDFWLGNKIIERAKGFCFEFLIDRKRGSIDNIYRSAATMCMAQNEQSGEAKMVVLLHFASRYIDIATSMLACTNYRLIIKLTASTRSKEKTVLCIAQFKSSGWTFDSRSISTFYPQIMQSCTQSANWAKKIMPIHRPKRFCVEHQIFREQPIKKVWLSRRQRPFRIAYLLA